MHNNTPAQGAAATARTLCTHAHTHRRDLTASSTNETVSSIATTNDDTCRRSDVPAHGFGCSPLPHNTRTFSSRDSTGLRRRRRNQGGLNELTLPVAWCSPASCTARAASHCRRSIHRWPSLWWRRARRTPPPSGQRGRVPSWCTRVGCSRRRLQAAPTAVIQQEGRLARFWATWKLVGSSCPFIA